MSKKLSKTGSVFQWIFIIVTLFAVICLILAYSAYYLSPTGSFSYLAFFGLAYPVILLANLVIMLIWLCLWKKFFWIPFFAILIGFNHISALVQIDFNPEKPTAGSLKIMTFNVHNLDGIEGNKKDRSTRSRIIDFLKIQKPDILCLQEFYLKNADTSGFFDRFNEAINSKYYFYQNYYEYRKKRGIDAIATFSRYPFIGNGSLKLNQKEVFAIYSDIIIDEEKIRVYNIHLESFHLGNEDYSFYSKLSERELDRLKFQDGFYKIIAKLRKAFIIRAQQVEILRESIAISPYPVIICGDFNDTPTSYSYNILKDDLYDSFRKAGVGFFGSTYAGRFPSFRIDYILFDKSFKAYEYHKHNTDLSDHFPVSVYINITPSL